MKISICDICKLKEDKMTEATYRRGFTNSMKIDCCTEHKEYPMGETPQEFSEAYFKMAAEAK